MEQDATHSHGEDSVRCNGNCGFPSSRLYGGLLLAYPSSATAPLGLHLAVALTLASAAEDDDDVIKRGYLGKLDRSHRRYFVLREGSHTGPSRLEWYRDEEKFKVMEKSTRKDALFEGRKYRVIYLQSCICVSMAANSRKGHKVMLYTKDQTLVLVAEDQGAQEEWYLAIKKLTEERRNKEMESRDGEDGGERFDEEDDGYCTLPPAAIFKEVWPVTVKPRGLGRTKSLAGKTRLCLSVTSLVLVRMGAGSELPSVTLPLLSVRRFGHSDGLFFLELGRTAPHGPGEIWMETGDQGDPALAQHMHEVIRETMRELRALPDFSRSPTTSHSYRNQPKWSRPLYLSSPSRGQSERHASMTQFHLGPCTPERAEQMTMGDYLRVVKVAEDHSDGIPVVTEDHCCVPANKVAGREPGEERWLGYMMMSPQHGCSSPEDDYVTMASLHTASSSSSRQTSFNSPASHSYSALHQSNHQIKPDWLFPAIQQSEMLNISCSSLGQPDEQQKQKIAFQMASGRHLPVQATSTSCPVEINLSFIPPTSVVLTSNSRPVQSNLIQSSPVQANQYQSAVRRYWLSTCLLSCLHAEDKP